MRTLFVALIGCMVWLPLPAVAQNHESEATQQDDWSRVRRLKHGADITIAIRGSEPIRRSIVQAEATHITVLNLTDLALPHNVARVLMNAASTHPDTFARSGTLIDGNVSVGPVGIFLRGQKVAEVQDVVETIARDDIVEITARRKGGGILGHLGPLGGYFVGGLTAGYIGALLCRCDAGFMGGMLPGGIVGGVAGYRAAGRESERLIYRAAY